MLTLIQPFINLLLFRAGPSDMPASITVLKFAITTCFITDLISALSSFGPSMAILLSVGQISLLAGLVLLLLKLHQKTDRWLQTLIALFGALALINLFSLPFIGDIKEISSSQITITPGLMIVGVFQLWFFITMVRVLRDALEISVVRAALLGFLILNIIPVVLSPLIKVLGLKSTLPTILPSDSL